MVKLDTRILGLFFIIMVWTIWITVIDFGVGLVFFLLALQKITLSKIGEYFFLKNSAVFMKFMLAKKPILIRSFLVI